MSASPKQLSTHGADQAGPESAASPAPHNGSNSPAASPSSAPANGSDKSGSGNRSGASSASKEDSSNSSGSSSASGSGNASSASGSGKSGSSKSGSRSVSDESKDSSRGSGSSSSSSSSEDGLNLASADKPIKSTEPLGSITRKRTRSASPTNLDAADPVSSSAGSSPLPPKRLRKTRVARSDSPPPSSRNNARVNARAGSARPARQPSKAARMQASNVRSRNYAASTVASRAHANLPEPAPNETGHAIAQARADAARAAAAAQENARALHAVSTRAPVPVSKEEQAARDAALFEEQYGNTPPGMRAGMNTAAGTADTTGDQESAAARARLNVDELYSDDEADDKVASPAARARSGPVKPAAAAATAGSGPSSSSSPSSSAQPQPSPAANPRAAPSAAPAADLETVLLSLAGIVRAEKNRFMEQIMNLSATVEVLQAQMKAQEGSSRKLVASMAHKLAALETRVGGLLVRMNDAGV